MSAPRARVKTVHGFNRREPTLFPIAVYLAQLQIRLGNSALQSFGFGFGFGNSDTALFTTKTLKAGSN